MTWNPNNNHQRVCFTANIPDGKTFTDFPMETLCKHLRPCWLIAQPEKGEHAHWQGFFQLKKRTAGKTIMKAFQTWGIRAHLEVARGTDEHQRAYCHKEKSCVDATLRFEYGEPRGGQGTRNDLGALFQAVKDGVDGVDLVETNPGAWAVHRRALEEYRTMLQPKRN